MSALHQDEKKIIESVLLFSKLTATDFENIYNAIQVRSLQAGSKLISQDEYAYSMFIILNGKLEVYINQSSGDRLVLAILERGDIVGEDSLASNANKIRTANVVVMENSRIAEIPAQLIVQLAAKYSDFKDHLVVRQSAHTYERLLKTLSHLHDVHVAPFEMKYIREESYQLNEIIFSEEEEGDAIYFILHGQVQVFKKQGRKEKIIARLGKGQCFGELALLDTQKRTGTVRAEQLTKVLRVDKVLFLKWHAAHPIFRDMLQSLKQVYHLQDESLISVHMGQYEGKDCISTVRQRIDGAQFISTKIINEDTVLFYKVVEGEKENIKSISYCSPDLITQRELQLQGNTLIGVVVRGSWSKLNQIVGMILNGQTIPTSIIALFQKKGDIRLEYASELICSNTVICTCMQVSYGDICRVVGEASDNINQVIAATGSTLVCGGCKPLIEDLLGNVELITLKIDSIRQVTKDSWSLHLQPLHGELPSYQPGQYIVLRAKLGEEWIQRSYTLAGHPNKNTWEIIVLRHSLGLMSNWLTSGHTDNLLLQALPPRGSFTVTSWLNDIVFFAGGIGVTPALAMLRAKIPGFFLYYSAHSEDDFIDKKQLEKNSNVILNCTSKHGRLLPAQVNEMMRQHPNAAVMICGPEGYHQMVLAALSQLNVAVDRIRFESFLPDEQFRRANSYCKPVFLKPVFCSKRANKVERFLNDVYSYFGLLSTFKKRLYEVKTEIKKYGYFTPTSDEVSFGIRKILEKKVNINQLHILDRRHVNSEDKLKKVLDDHQSLAEITQDSVVVTVLADNVKLPADYSILSIELTPYCFLKVIIAAPYELIPSTLHYISDSIDALPVPLAKFGKQKIPIIGMFFVMMGFAARPAKLVMQYKKKIGQVFSVRIPFVFNLIYVGREAFHNVLESSIEVSRIGPILLLLPAIGYWFKRTQPKNAEWAQSLALSCRRFIADHLVNAYCLTDMPAQIKQMVKEKSAHWDKEIDLEKSLVELIYDISISCLIEKNLWSDIRDAIIPLLCITANGPDIVRIARAKLPFHIFMPEYIATKKLQKLTDQLFAQHKKYGTYPFLDKLAEIQVEGKPIPEMDHAWALLFILSNATTYPGSYGLRCLIHILSHPHVYADLKSKNQEEREILLSACLTETMRLNPVSSLARKLACPVNYKLNNKEYRLPKNSIIAIFPYEICHDETLYADPAVFNPYRYAKGEKVPELFGRGPFGCVARQFSYVLLTNLLGELLNNHDFKLLGEPPEAICRVGLLYPECPVRVEVL